MWASAGSSSDRGGKPVLCSKLRVFRKMLRGNEQERPVVTEVHIRTGFVLQLMNEFRIHPCTGRSQWLKCGRGFDDAIDQHAASGMRGFSPRFATVYDQHRRAFLAEFDREREPDDAAPDNDHVPTLHPRIVEESAPVACELIDTTALVLNN